MQSLANALGADAPFRRYFFTAAAFLPLLSAAARTGHTGTVINVSSMSGITRTSQHHFKM